MSPEMWRAAPAGGGPDVPPEGTTQPTVHTLRRADVTAQQQARRSLPALVLAGREAAQNA
jgi:hypothetical protein